MEPRSSLKFLRDIITLTQLHDCCWRLTTVLLRIPVTQMIVFDQGMLLPGSNHFVFVTWVELESSFGG